MVVKDKYDGKIDLLKLILPVHLPGTIYNWFLEGEPEILVLINQFYHRIDFLLPC